jgi:hypothetical protein
MVKGYFSIDLGFRYWVCFAPFVAGEDACNGWKENLFVACYELWNA